MPILTSAMNRRLSSHRFAAALSWVTRQKHLQNCLPFCADKGILLQIHSNEHFPEVHECILRYGMRPTELLHRHDVLSPHVLLHHTTLVSEVEIELIVETDTATTYNPLASVWKGNAVAPASGLRSVVCGLASDPTPPQLTDLRISWRQRPASG